MKMRLAWAALDKSWTLYCGKFAVPPGEAPSLLVSYAYLKEFMRFRRSLIYTEWVLDSGAFTANSQGKEIKLDDYIDACKALMETAPEPVEIFALDVIGDHEATIRNTEKMWEAGIKAIPCYHVNEPEWVLEKIAKEYPKIALGGMAVLRGRRRRDWVKECFDKIWPKKVHGFGVADKEGCLIVPWDTTDASSWIMGPQAYGRWRKFGYLGIRDVVGLRSELTEVRRLEEMSRTIWKDELDELENEKAIETRT